MIILGIDSAGSGCAACVWQDGKVLCVKSEPMLRGQDARLIPLVMDVMDEAGISFERIDRVAVTKGPGSFTGLRVGISAARGLGLAANKDVIGIDRFSIYEAQHKSRPLLVVLDSRRQELFCKLFEAHGAQDVALMTPQEIANKVRGMADIKIAGDTADILCDQAGLSVIGNMEAEVVTCAALAAAAVAGNEEFLPRPLYLRQPDVTVGKERCFACASGAP